MRLAGTRPQGSFATSFALSDGAAGCPRFCCPGFDDLLHGSGNFRSGRGGLAEGPWAAGAHSSHSPRSTPRAGVRPAGSDSERHSAATAKDFDDAAIEFTGRQRSIRGRHRISPRTISKA